MKPSPNSHGLFNQIDALRYMIAVYEEESVHEDEWTMASMYNALEQIIKAESTTYFQPAYLEQLMKKSKI